MFSIDATEKNIRKKFIPIHCLEESHENLMMLRLDTFLGRFHGKLPESLILLVVLPVGVESERFFFEHHWRTERRM